MAPTNAHSDFECFLLQWYNISQLQILPLVFQIKLHTLWKEVYVSVNHTLTYRSGDFIFSDSRDSMSESEVESLIQFLSTS